MDNRKKEVVVDWLKQALALEVFSGRILEEYSRRLKDRDPEFVRMIRRRRPWR